MTWGNSRTSERSFSKNPVLRAYQNPEALNLTINMLRNEHLQVKLFEQRDIMHDTQMLTMPLRRRNKRGAENMEEGSEFFACLLA